ncbi:exosortase-associated EpsI family protein [Planctomycetota bacterium]
MKSENSHRAVIAAIVVACGLMLAFGVTYRVMAGRLRLVTDASLLSSDVLADLPMQLGEWVGRDVPLDEIIVKRTDADALIHRQYTQNTGVKSVLFYVACGTNMWEMARHEPRVCYPAAGWELVDCRTEELSLDSGIVLPFKFFRFSREGFDLKEMTVLHYVVVDGHFYSDVPLMHSRTRSIVKPVKYIAQVQIVRRSGGMFEKSSAKRMIHEFALASISPLKEVFNKIDIARKSDR